MQATPFGRPVRLLAVLVILACAIGYAGCSAPESQPASLVVPGNASDVHYTALGGTKQVMYKVKDGYPADATLEYISGRLKTQGWRVLKEDFRNPGHPTSHVTGWTVFIDATKKGDEEVRQWLGQWTNADGDVVEYGLRYSWRIGATPDLDNLRVVGIYVPAEIARHPRGR